MSRPEGKRERGPVAEILAIDVGLIVAGMALAAAVNGLWPVLVVAGLFLATALPSLIVLLFFVVACGPLATEDSCGIR